MSRGGSSDDAASLPARCGAGAGTAGRAARSGAAVAGAAGPIAAETSRAARRTSGLRSIGGGYAM
jgi:hypothetical protein